MRALRLARKQRGVAMVEAVIVLPVLIFLMLAAAEVTNVFIQHNSLTKVVRDGARFMANNAILGSTGAVVLQAQFMDDARNIVVYGNTAGTGSPLVYGLQTSDVVITEVAPLVVEVTATYPYTGLLGAILPGVGGQGSTSLAFNLSATVSMRAIK